MVQLDDFEKVLISLFLSEEWWRFLRFCSDRDVTESDAEALLAKLEKDK
jgi:hypothetical protein